jgi:peptidoglycan/xylan/chitin deacetylase (PgdA/CDA1 family)
VELGADLRLIALTFDLCEAARAPAGYDARIVNYLREEKVPATFYTGGKWMRSHPETTMQLLADPLFEIGNHSDTHESLRTLSLARLSEQILSPQAEYARLRATLLARSCATGFTRDAETALPALPATFRFPFGTCRPEALAAVAAAGMPAVQWNIVTGDPAASTSAAAITATVLAQARPGAIIVAHANGRGVHTAEALPRIIPELRRRGFRFVTVSELLRSGRPVLTDTCYELKPGDNAHYGRRSTRPHPP